MQEYCMEEYCGDESRYEVTEEELRWYYCAARNHMQWLELAWQHMHDEMHSNELPF